MSDSLSWWAVNPERFYEEAARRASMRVNKPDGPPRSWQAPMNPKRRRKPLPTPAKICEVCHQPFSLNLRGPQRIYCSQYCNAKAWKSRQKKTARRSVKRRAA